MTAVPLLLVLPSLSRGGAERHAVYLATALDPARWRPRVLAFGDGPFRTELEAAGVPVQVVDAPGGARAVPAAVAAVRAAVDADRPGLVSCHAVLPELAVRLALRGTGVPSIVWKHTYGHIGHRGLRERWVEKLTGAGVTRYGAVCHTQVRYLTDSLGLPTDKISVVANSVPVPAELPAPPSGPPFVLMVAAMRADKDHARVLQAWPAVLAEHPDARLRLAGDGPCRAGLERQAADLGIAGSVEFLGVRTDGEALLRDAALLVLASYRIECFPYAALEAMAAARGVVSTDVGGLPELVDDGVTGRLVPPMDVDALAAALVEGLTDATSVTPRWGPAGWERARRVFPFNHWSQQVDDLFSRLVTGRSTAQHPEEDVVVKRLRTVRVTPLLAGLLIAGLTAAGVGAGWLVERSQGEEYQVRTDVLIRFWGIEGYLLNGQVSTVTSLDVADAATLASSLDVLDDAAADLDDGRTGTDLSSAVTVTPSTTSNAVSIVATDSDPDTALATSEAVATAMTAAVEDRIGTAADSLADDAEGDFAVGLQQRAEALSTTVQPLQALASGEAVQTAPNAKTPLAMGIVGLAAAALVLVGLVFGRPVVSSAREAQRLLEVPAVPFTDGRDDTTDLAAARLVRRLLDDRPTGSIVVVPVDHAADKTAQQFVSWARNHCSSPAEADRLTAVPEPAGVVLRPRPASAEVAAVLLVAPAGTHRRDLTDAATLLRTWRAADAAVLATGAN